MLCMSHQADISMSTENPYDAPTEAEIVEEDSGQPELSDGRAVYNAVSDTVTGANLRLSDNCMQAVCILVCIVLGAGIGAIFVAERIPGAIVGGLIGMLVGLFGSGIFLMIYRAVRHASGKHD